MHCSFQPVVHTSVNGDLSTRGRGTLYKVLYREAPPRGSTPYPFVDHFDKKVPPFVYLLLKKQ